MGSSGGGWHSWPRNTDVDKVIKESESTEARAEYEREVNQYLQSLLTNFNDRRAEEIQQHLDNIKKALEKDIDGAVDLVFGGSVSKHTYVNGLSDVDMLVRINDSSLVNASPDEVKQYFAARLKARFPNSEVKVGNLAVTIRFSSTGHEIQLLPSLQTKTGLKIANPNGSGWSKVIKPSKFAEKLTDVNQTCGNKVVPVVKLFKSLNASLPDNAQLSGYHIESLAIEAFESYTGRKTYKDMLQHLCRTAAKLVLSPIADSTGQSVHVDEYLGKLNSYERRTCSAALDRLSNRLGRGDAHMTVDRWKEQFTDE